MPDLHPPQIFKNRKAALSWLRAKGVPVGQTKFYDDCDKFGLIQPDKSVQLSSLVAYLETEHQIGPAGPARDISAEQRARDKEDLEIRKLTAEVEAKERANRKEDDRWMEVVEHETQMAAFAGLIEESLQQITTIKLSELIFLCGGDIRRAPEFARALQDVYGAALTEAVREQTKAIAFEDDDAGA